MPGERRWLNHTAYVDHAVGWIGASEAATLHHRIREALAWEAREIVIFGRRILQPRLIAWGGDMPYRYSGQTLPPRPLPAEIASLVERVNTAAGTLFNHVLANRYRDGKDSMGLHADAEPELGPDPVVATLSFGAPRRLSIVPRKKEDGPKREVVLAHGDLFIMAGTCQRDFRHAIPRPTAREGDVTERISLTLRHVLRAPDRG